MNESRRRWEQLRDRESLGEALTREELEFCERHELEHPEDALESEAWGQMLAGLRDEADSENDIGRARAARLGRQALERHRVEGPAVEHGGRGRAAWIAAAVAVAAGVAWLVVPDLVQDSDAPPMATAEPKPREPSAPEGDVEPKEAAPAEPARDGASFDGVLALEEGSILADASDMTVGTSTRGVGIIESERGRGCIVFDAPFAVACLDEGSRIELAKDLPTGHRTLALEQGRVIVSLDPLTDDQGFSVETPGGTVTALGTIFEVEVDAEHMRTTVSEGAVTFVHAGTSRRLHAGQMAAADLRAPSPSAEELDEASAAEAPAIARGLAVGKLAEIWRAPQRGVVQIVAGGSKGTSVGIDGIAVGAAPVDLLAPIGHHELSVANAVAERTSDIEVDTDRIERVEVSLPSKSTRPAVDRGPSADELWTRAQAARKAGQYDRAARLYDEMLEVHPNHPRSRNVAVRLGDLLVKRDPKRALAAYDRYLAKGGALAPEAKFGRIRALRALGRKADEKRSIEAFLNAYPRDMRCDSLRARLERL